MPTIRVDPQTKETVRQLAAQWHISPVTAQKVFKRLKDSGLLVADSTNPAMISPAAVALVRGASAAGRNWTDSGRSPFRP